MKKNESENKITIQNHGLVLKQTKTCLSHNYSFYSFLTFNSGEKQKSHSEYFPEKLFNYPEICIVN